MCENDDRPFGLQINKPTECIYRLKYVESDYFFTADIKHDRCADNGGDSPCYYIGECEDYSPNKAIEEIRRLMRDE